ncbi:MAG: biopolymer transporter ExbD [Verrucomicrobiota bacterium]
MKRRKHKQSSEVNLGFQIAPMVDVVFVIMLFFMVMAGAVQVENTHNTKLPGTIPSDADTPIPDEVAIRIDDDGQVFLNDESFDTPQVKSLPDLAINLKQLQEASKASNTAVMVTIYAAENSKYERIIDVLDALTRAGISNVTFQAVAPE